MVQVVIKWGSESFQANTEDFKTGGDLKQFLWEKTKISIPKQKIIGFKGGILADHVQLSDLHIKPGMKVMLVGTPEGSELKTNPEPSSFTENVTPLEKFTEDIPNGLINCGTSCYFNAVIQFLRPVKEFTESMKILESESGRETIDASFCAALRSFYKKKDTSNFPDNPIFLIHLLRTKFTQFATMAPGNKNFMQQDAEECLSVLLEFLNSQKPPQFVDNIFSFQLETTISSKDEEETNSPTVKHEKLRILPSHLGSQLTAIDHLYQGIERSLTEKFTRFSSQLNRQVECEKQSRIASLPEYLIVHFVRFEWKGRHELARTEAGRAKICRKVSFPSVLDIHKFTTQQLQRKLEIRRRLCHTTDLQSNDMDNVPKRCKPDETASSSSLRQTDPSDDTSTKHQRNETSMATDKSEHISLGEYELMSIITHQGRSADKGHYVAWVKHDEETWWKFDDEQVTETPWKTIDLSGGRSDYHVAILLLYKQKYIPISQSQLELLQQAEAVKDETTEATSCEKKD